MPDEKVLPRPDRRSGRLGHTPEPYDGAPTSASQERWNEVKAIFQDALQRAPEDRREFICAACGDDDVLRLELESLLEAEESAGDFLEAPAVPAWFSMEQLDRLRSALDERYVIERELGRGGMATVYLAYDRRHDRSVALKVLHPELGYALGPNRFRQEIRTAARLQHPHILSVHDSGETDKHLWYTMPLVEGGSLRERLTREKRLPVEEALSIARDCAKALDYAHRHGVIHRDIKPENILLTAEGDTLIADFGLGRPISPAVPAERLTEMGVLVGTPGYMAPEQAAGEQALDGRTDIYALGVVLYEMLTGELPDTGRPPLHSVRPDMPIAVESALARALSPLRTDRWASAGEFARALGFMTTPVPGREAPLRTGTLPSFSGVPSLLLGMVLLAGSGVLLWLWERPDSHPPTVSANESSSAIRLAVLPFENLGRPAQDYFTDGLTDEVRGKLTGLPGLEVIARGSSNQYKGTTKSAHQIGEELRVRYLLTGTVRWSNDGAPGGVSRVQVNPELVEVDTGVAQWRDSFEAGLFDIFRVQAQVGEQVAEALGVELNPEERERLEEQPTRNVDAYDAYLKGRELHERGGSLPELHSAISHHQRAVTLDPTFALAWAALGRAYVLAFTNSTARSVSDLQRSREAAERALRLAPGLPTGHLALGEYYHWGLGDRARGIAEYSLGLEQDPNNPQLLAGLAAAEQSEGDWDAAILHLRQAAALDPRSSTAFKSLAGAMLWLRRYPEALAACDRAIDLAPGTFAAYHDKVMVYLAESDLAGARAVLESAAQRVDRNAILAEMGMFWDLYWVLSEQDQMRLLRLTPEHFGGDTMAWALALAATQSMRGESERARVYADQARRSGEDRLKELPDNAQLHVLLGVALAYSGDHEAALVQGRRGTALLPLARDAWQGAYLQHQMVRIHLLGGDHDLAIAKLELLLRIPYYLSPGWLRIDPTFEPLRNHPQFQRLVAGASSSTSPPIP